MAVKFKGVAAANGIAIAPLVRFHTGLDFIPTRTLAPEDVEAEVQRFEDAVQTVSRQILFLSHELAQSLPDQDMRIYDAQLALLHDETFRQDIIREITQSHANVEVAIQRAVARYEAVFERLEDALMRERAADLRDVGRQLLAVLMERERSVYTAKGQDYIFAADEFLPSDAGLVDREHLKGIVTASGGKYSHGAILARSLGIPAVVAVEGFLQRAPSGALAILDGDSGLLLVDPGEEEIERYRALQVEQSEVERRVFEVRYLSSRTPDGTEIRLYANVESARDLERVEPEIVHGIGLFRTEFAFMERRHFPTEDEQVAMYRKAIEWAGGKVVTFRTLDIGGDKPLSYFRTPEERNPVLGWRGLRISLDWPDLFYTQVRAILRASAGGHARILLPMVTSVEEVRRCRAVLDELCADLESAGEPFDTEVELGAMVEVPILVDVLDHVLPLVDFVSVGTNDLVQYLLAVDRDNPRIAQMYTPYHPGVLRVLARIARTAEAHGRPASICGEIAGDHYFTPILLGLGYRDLSMASVFLPRVKLMVRASAIDECRAFTAEILALDKPSEVRAMARDRAKARYSRFLQGSDR